MKRFKQVLLIGSALLLIFVIVVNIPENRKEFKTTHFTFLFNSSIDSSNIVHLSKVLESNYSRIGDNLNTQPAEHIEVNIYAQRWRYIKASGNWNASGSIEGISKLHFMENAWLETEISKIAIHEFVHTVVLKLLIDKASKPLNIEKFDQKFSELPVWIWEAVSTYEADQFYDPNSLEYFKNDRYPQISELNNRSDGQKIYTCGYTLIEYILEEYGKNKLIELIASYGNIEDVLSVTEKEFSDNWHQYLKNKYGLK